MDHLENIKYLSHHHKDIYPETLFFLLNKNPYLNEILRNSNIKVIVSQLPRPDNCSTIWVQVDNIHHEMARISSRFYPINPDCKIIGITGTNGKTSICWLLYQMLNKLNLTTGYIGTLGIYYENTVLDNNLTTPDPIDLYRYLSRISKCCQYITLEVTSHSLYWHKVNYIDFRVIGLTNITQDHLDFHLTMENYINCKKKIFTLNHQASLINIDSDVTDKISSELNKQNNFTISRNKKSDYSISEVSFTSSQSHFSLNNKIIKTCLLGDYMVDNLGFALSILSIIDINLDLVLKYLINISNIPGRLEIIHQKPLVIVDFAHTPDSVEVVLKSIKKLYPQKKINVTLGFGGDRDKSKRQIMFNNALKYSDQVLVTSDNPRTEDALEICKSVKIDGNLAKICVDRREAISEIFYRSSRDDIVIILGKGHENYIIFGKEKYYFDDRIQWKIIDKFYNKRILVLGDGVSGRSVVKKLNGKSICDIYTDENKCELNNKYDIIVSSPGFPINHPVYQKLSEVYTIGELELAYQFHHQANWVAITGSAGKTTTTSMIGSIFNLNKPKTTFVVGNIGKAACSLNDYLPLYSNIITEVSSFQLEKIDKFKPHIAIITNIYENHLDYHDTMDNYIKAKSNITKNQTEQDILLLPLVNNFNINTKAKIIYFGLEYLDRSNYLCLKNNLAVLDKKTLFSLENFKLRGKHNKLNALYSGFIAYKSGINRDIIERGLNTFIPIKHRYTLYNGKNNIIYVDDSSSTVAESTVCSIKQSNRPTHLILGGVVKSDNTYPTIWKEIQSLNNIKQVYCYGTSRYNAKKSIKNIIIRETLDEILSIIKLKNNDRVLLSPACTSFDQYSNYKERGDKFIGKIQELDLL